MAGRILPNLFENIRQGEVEKLEENLKKWRQEGGVRNELGGHVMLVAAKHGHPGIIRALLRAGVHVMQADEDERRPLHHAAQLGSVDVVKQILNAGSPVNVADNAGYTALHIAASHGHADLVELLLNEGAHMNRSRLYKTGDAVIHLACHNGKLSVLEVLLRRGANVAFKNNEEKTALHVASQRNHKQLVKLLCQNGADVDAQTASGETCLMLAAHNGQPDILNILLDSGANTRLQNSNGYTALHYLSVNSSDHLTEQHIECAWNLLRGDDNFARATGIAEGGLIHMKDVSGRQAVHVSSLMNNDEITSMLIACGADVNSCDLIGDTPLLSAIRDCSLDTANVLIHSGADINCCDRKQLTPLHLALRIRGTKKVNLVVSLLNKGAKLNTRCSFGRSVLDVCVFHYVMGDYSNRYCLVLLIQAGIHLKHVVSVTGYPAFTRQPKSPLCWLTWNGHFAAARFLVNSGWDIQSEEWLHLPGKTQEIQNFQNWLIEISKNPDSLMAICRNKIRCHMVFTNGDCDITTQLEQLPLPDAVKGQLLLRESSAMLANDSTGLS